MGSIYSSRSTSKSAWSNSVTHIKKSQSITDKKHKKKSQSITDKKQKQIVRNKDFIKKENELKGKCMSLSLTYEPPKDQETHAELKLRHLRINRHIKNKQKITSSKNITANKQNVNDLQPDISNKSKTDQNIKNKQKISSPKNNTDQNVQKEEQKGDEIDTQEINMPVQSNNNSQVQYDIDMVIERQPVSPQEIQCPNAIYTGT